MTEQEHHRKIFTGYEYKEIAVESRKASMYQEGYENFGWELEEHSNVLQFGSEVMLFKRDRKIMNRTELTRLQRNFEDCMRQIKLLENSVTEKATGAALGVGILGTVFLAASVFAVTANPPWILPGILLAIPGFVGWGVPYFIYKRVASKRVQVVEPLIEEKFDEIYAVCEKGQQLLG